MSEKLNREVLFRGKQGDNGEWVEGFLSYFAEISVPIKDDTVGFLQHG